MSSLSLTTSRHVLASQLSPSTYRLPSLDGAEVPGIMEARLGSFGGPAMGVVDEDDGMGGSGVMDCPAACEYISGVTGRMGDLTAEPLSTT